MVIVIYLKWTDENPLKMEFNKNLKSTGLGTKTFSFLSIPQY